MGNSASQAAALQTCLNQVFAANPSAVGYPTGLLYQLQYVKPYNLDIPVTPAAVTRPSTADEVAAVIRCASASNLKVQPRSGGHSFGNYGTLFLPPPPFLANQEGPVEHNCLLGLGGQGEDAVVIDLVNFQQFSMDTATWQATIGAGTLLSDVTEKLHDAGGRAMAHGICLQVGIGGHATIGGLGPTSRMWGSALDHILEVEVALANGTVTRANSTQHPDLFFVR